jgi:predicted nucleotidyltransferase
MLDLFTSKQKEIAEICRKHHVQRLLVFGSAVRRDFDQERSDLDLRVEFEPIPIETYADNYFDLRDALIHLFGRDIDLISSKTIRNPFFREELEATQVLVYAA